MKKYICIIPARIGSKRLKKKNIKFFFKKPIIEYPITVAKKSGLFKKIIISTDSVLIKKIVEKYDCHVPYLRSKKLSNDKALPTDVIIDIVKKLQIKEKYIFCIYPCNPFLKIKLLKKAINLIKKREADCLLIAKKFESHPLRSLIYNKNKNFMKLRWKKFEKYNSQNLEVFYHDTGMFYIYKTKSLLSNKKIFPKKTVALLIKKYQSIDINDNEDFKFAKFIYKNKLN